jgi:hypothetical protein
MCKIFIKLNFLLLVFSIIVTGCAVNQQMAIPENFFSFCDKKNLPEVSCKYGADAKINELSFKFTINNSLGSKEKCRERVIGMVDEIVKIINSTNNYAIYFSPWPITQKNINIQLIFKDTEEKYLVDNNISSLMFENEEISFYKFNATTSSLEKTYSETYEEAQKNMSFSYEKQ